MIDFILLQRLPPSILPGLTAYNISMSDPLPVSNIYYMPGIEASRIQLSTVNHLLEQSLNIVEKLACESIIVVFDQAI